MKRDMQRRAEGIMPSPSAHKENSRPKRVKFSSLDTIHTFADKSIPSTRITAEEPMSHRIEVQKPKTSEYKYFKKLKPFNNQDHPCLGSSKMKKKHEALVLVPSDIKNDKVAEDLVTTKISINSRTCVSPFLDGQCLEIQAIQKKNVDSDGKLACLVDGKWCLVATSSSHCAVDRVSNSISNQLQSDFRKVHDYEKAFHRKRKKLQDLAARALSVERRDLSLHRSKSLLTLLQRLEVPNNGNLVATLHDNDLENSKCTSFGVEKSYMQSNFQPKTSIPLDMKSDFQKACAPFEISSDIERLGHTHHGNNLLKVKTSKFDPEDYLSLISLTTDEVSEYIINRGSYKCSLHWLADTDIGIHSLCSKQQLTPKNGIDLENIYDTRSLHQPHSLSSRMWSIDYDDTWSSEDIALFSGDDKLLKSKISNFQYEDHFSLISPWGADRIHHYGTDNYEYHRHGLSDVEFGTRSVCTNQQVAHGINFEHDKILETKFRQNPYSLFSRMCFIDYYHKQRVEDFSNSLYLDIQQPKGCYAFDMLPVERDDINYKDDGFSSLKGITMQLPDHINGFSCYRQDVCPEMGKASWTSPEKTICFNLLLNHEDKQKHCEEKHIPENNLVLWGSSNENVLKRDRIKDLCFEDKSHNFSCIPSLWDADTDYASPILESNFSTIQLQLQNGNDRWEDLKESSHFLYGEATPSQEHHKLLHITDGVHMSEQHNFAQVHCAGVATLDNLHSQNRKNTRFPMKLNLQMQNDLNIPDISLTMEEEQECLSASIHPLETAAMQLLNCDHDSYEEHAGLTPCTDFSLRSKWQTSEKWPKEFSCSNGTNCLVIDNRQCHSCEICHGDRSSYRFNSFQCED